MKGRLLPASGGSGTRPSLLPLDLGHIKLAAEMQANRDAVKSLLGAFMAKTARAEEWTGSLAYTAGPKVSKEEAENAEDTHVNSGIVTDPHALDASPRGIKVNPSLVERGISDGQDINKIATMAGFGQVFSTLGRGARAAGSRIRGLFRGTRGASPGVPSATGAPYRSAPAGSPVPPQRPVITGGAGTAGQAERAAARKSQRVAARGQVAPAQAPPVAPPVGRQGPGLIGSLVPGALMAGAAYGLYKGVPRAAHFLSEAGEYPMAYGGGFQQYQHGFTPEGQAQF